MSHVKASIIEARRRFVIEHHGHDAWDRVSATLPDAYQAQLKHKLRANQWVSFDLFTALNRAIDRELGAGDLQICRQLGYIGAGYTLPTVFRVFYRFSSVGFIMRRASQLWGNHYDSGTARLEEHEGKDVTLHIENFESPDTTHCLSIQGWCERAIELSGGKRPVTEIVACRKRGDAQCSFHCRWS